MLFLVVVVVVVVGVVAIVGAFWHCRGSSLGRNTRQHGRVIDGRKVRDT